MSDHHESAWKENARFTADLINRVGFPVCVSIFLGWLILFKMEEQKSVVIGSIDRLAVSFNNLAMTLQRDR